MRKALIRCEAGGGFGFGHAVRCAAIGRRLQHAGWDVSVAISEAGYHQVRDLSGFHWVPEEALLTAPADLVILDMVTLESDLEQKLARAGRPLLVIDDAPQRAHAAHWLVDATPGRTAGEYAALAPQAIALTGARYAPVRESFRRARAHRKGRVEEMAPVTHILVAFGGSDPANRTGLALNAIAQAAADIRTTVIIGQGAPHLESLRQQITALPNVTLRVDPDPMADAMAEGDLVIGGAGTSAWERCCLGLPSLVVVAADNQREWAQRLAALGVARVAEPTVAALATALTDLLADPAARAQMAQAGRELIDGRGVDRLFLALSPGEPILEGRISLRLLEAEDLPLLQSWRDDPSTRPFARLTSESDRANIWEPGALDDPDTLLLMAIADGTTGQTPVGFLRLDRCTHPQPGWEVVIATAPNHTRRGIGRAALRLLGRVMPRDAIFAHISAGDEASHSFFRALGYMPISEEWYRANHSPI